MISRGRFPVAVYVIVFCWAVALFAALLFLGAGVVSEDSTALAALVSYGSYIIASAALSITVYEQTRTRWLALYLGVMAPYILLVSWMPITASWTEAFAWRSEGLRVAANIGNNAILAGATAVSLLGISGLPFARSRLRPLTTIVSVLIPISLWITQVVFVSPMRSPH